MNRRAFLKTVIVAPIAAAVAQMSARPATFYGVDWGLGESSIVGWRGDPYCNVNQLFFVNCKHFCRVVPAIERRDGDLYILGHLYREERR